MFHTKMHVKLTYFTPLKKYEGSTNEKNKIRNSNFIFRGGGCLSFREGSFVNQLINERPYQKNISYIRTHVLLYISLAYCAI